MKITTCTKIKIKIKKLITKHNREKIIEEKRTKLDALHVMWCKKRWD